MGIIVNRVSCHSWTCDIPQSVFPRMPLVQMVAIAWFAIVFMWWVKPRWQARKNPSHLMVFGATMGFWLGGRSGGEFLSGPLVKCISSGGTSKPLMFSQ